MADETLRLTVDLVDNATPQLARIRGQMQNLGSSETSNALRTGTQRVKEMREHFKPLTEDIAKASEEIIPPFIRGIGGIATGMLALGVAAEHGIRSIKDFSTEMNALNRLSRETGVNAAQLKSIIETAQRAGIDPAKMAAGLGSLTEKLADLLRPYSKFRQEIIQATTLESRDAMGKDLDELEKMGAERLPEVLEKLKGISEKIFEHTPGGAVARKDWFAQLGIPDIGEVREHFEAVSAEAKKAQDEQIKAAKDFLFVTADIEQRWGHITEVWKENALKAIIPTLEHIDKFFKDWEEQGFFKTLKELPVPEGVPLLGGKQLGDNPLTKGAEEIKKRNDELLKQPAAPYPNLLPDWLNPWSGGSNPNVIPKIGPAGRIPQHQEGGFIPRDQFAMLHAGEMVQPAEGVNLMKRQVQETEKLVEQMTKLNDFLMRGVGGGPVTARMGGLAPGLGVGPASVGGGFDAGSGVGGGDGGLGGVLGGLPGGGGGGVLGTFLSGGGRRGGLGGLLGGLLGGAGGGGGGLGGGGGGGLGGLVGGGGGGGLGGLLGGGGGGGGGLGGLLGGGGGGGGVGGILGGLLGGGGGLLGGGHGHRGGRGGLLGSGGGGGGLGGVGGIMGHLFGGGRGSGLGGQHRADLSDDDKDAIGRGALGVPEGSMLAATGKPPAGFIMHHTSGRGTIAGVEETLRQRRLGVEYVMDREGNIKQTGGPGSSHMMTGWGKGKGLSNRNTIGMEVIAKDDRDVTPTQAAAAERFISTRYPNTPVFGHGEVNPGHKEATEGMTIVNRIRAARARGAPSTSGDGGTQEASQQQRGGLSDDNKAALSDQGSGGRGHGRGGGAGGALYDKLLAEFRANPPKGVPPDGARFGITHGTPEEYARFGASVAHAESGFNPRVKNLSDPGGSFGVLQYSHSQAYGNAYDVDNSVRAFVRDTNASVGGLRHGILGRRFSTIGSHPERGAAYLSHVPTGQDSQSDRGAMDRSMQHNVTGTGKISVDVNAPKGTNVRAQGGGLFKQTEVRRQTQMDRAPKRGEPATMGTDQ